MFIKGWVCGFINFSVIIALSLPSSMLAQKSEKEAVPEGAPVIWQEPADVSSRDLFLGPGGEAMKPDLSKVTFIKEKSGPGYSTKYDVRDGSGRLWVAKLGKEAQPETAANRLMWAVGYPTEISYFVPRVQVEGKGNLENVKFEARPEHIKRTTEWKWDSNPFVGTREFQGLKVMMVLVNNWDIKDENNKILHVRNEQTGANELHYIVSDLGGTFGKTGNFISRSRNKPADYVKAWFIDEVKGKYVDFHYNGKRKDLFTDITTEQAKWIGDLLARLSDKQLEDAFRAAGYGPDEVRMLAETIRWRINALVALAGSQTTTAESKQ